MILLIDANGLLHRSIHSRKLTTPSKSPYGMIPIGGVYGALDTLRMLLDDLEPAEVILCWDGGYSHRETIYPGYKQNRNRTPEQVLGIQTQRRILIEVLSYLPVVQIMEPGIEADDALCVVSDFAKVEDVAIVTGDRDLFQLQRKDRRLRFIGYGGRHHSLDGKPGSWWLQSRVLIGDSSDNIKGITDIGPVKAGKLLSEFGDLRGVLRHIKGSGKLGGMVSSVAIETIKRNLKLMKLGVLLSDAERTAILDQYRYGRLDLPFNQGEVTTLLSKLGFSSMLSRFSYYFGPYHGLVKRRPHREAESESVRKRIRAAYQEAQPIEQQKGHPARAETRRLRKVVSGHRRGGTEAGGGRRRPAEGEGKLGARREAQAGQGPSTVPTVRRSRRYPRIRKVVPHADAAESHRAGDPGAVPADQRGSAGERLEARCGRAGQSLAGLLATDEARERLKARRGRATTTLAVFSSGDGWEWLESQPSDRLQTVRRLIDVVRSEGNVRPSDLAALDTIYQDYVLAMPDWMKTDEERHGTTK